MTPVTENVRLFVGWINALIPPRWVDRGALAVALAFLGVAVILGLVWANDAHAATLQRLNVARTTRQVHDAERAEWRRHDKRGHGFAVRCVFADLLGKGSARTGEPVSCTFTVWRRADRRGRPLARLAYAVTVVPRTTRHAHLGEDGAGVVPVTAHRSLELDERPVR